MFLTGMWSTVTISIGRCGGDEKTKDHAEPTKVNTKKNQKAISRFHFQLRHQINQC